MYVANATVRAGLPPFAGTIIQEGVDNLNLEDSSNQPQGFVMIRPSLKRLVNYHQL